MIISFDVLTFFTELENFPIHFDILFVALVIATSLFCLVRLILFIIFDR